MELLLNGYITTDCDNHPALRDIDAPYWRLPYSIPTSIQEKFNYEYLEKGLGEKITYIPNCNLSIYYTENECTFEEAQLSLLNALEGNLCVHTKYIGYSEYTILGLDLEEFRIGGHDLSEELLNHIDEYCWIKIEV